MTQISFLYILHLSTGNKCFYDLKEVFVMNEDLNLIESQILRIFKNNQKQADDSLEFDIVLQQSLKALSDNFDMLVDSLVKKGYLRKSGKTLILTDKGDQHIYKKKLYSDY